MEISIGHVTYLLYQSEPIFINSYKKGMEQGGLSGVRAVLISI